MLGYHPPEAFHDLAHRLVELRLTGVTPQDLGKDRLKLFIYMGQDASSHSSGNERPEAAKVRGSPSAPRRESEQKTITLLVY
jgi:hypothetical protein